MPTPLSSTFKRVALCDFGIMTTVTPITNMQYSNSPLVKISFVVNEKYGRYNQRLACVI